MTTKTDEARECAEDCAADICHELNIDDNEFNIQNIADQIVKHFPPSAEDGSGSNEPCVPEMCPSCEDRCGGTEFYSYCPCCENFVGPTPPHWYHGPRGVPVSRLEALQRYDDWRLDANGDSVNWDDIEALIAEAEK